MFVAGSGAADVHTCCVMFFLDLEVSNISVHGLLRAVAADDDKAEEDEDVILQPAVLLSHGSVGNTTSDIFERPKSIL